MPQLPANHHALGTFTASALLVVAPAPLPQRSRTVNCPSGKSTGTVAITLFAVAWAGATFWGLCVIGDRGGADQDPRGKLAQADVGAGEAEPTIRVIRESTIPRSGSGVRRC